MTLYNWRHWCHLYDVVLTEDIDVTCIMLEEEFLSSAATEQNRMVLLVKLALTNPSTSSMTKLSPFQFLSTTGQPPRSATTRRNGASPTASTLPLKTVLFKVCHLSMFMSTTKHPINYSLKLWFKTKEFVKADVLYRCHFPASNRQKSFRTNNHIYKRNILLKAQHWS